jgi:hypothetical protein
MTWRRRRAPDVEPETGLDHCELCGRDFVTPIDWEPVGAEHWRLLLRCGECETWREVTVANAVAQRYDVELDRGARVLVASLERMDRERMVGEAEAMTIALELGLIDAADFGD